MLKLLMTPYGVPPQVIGSIAEENMRALGEMAMSSTDMRFGLWWRRDRQPPELQNEPCTLQYLESNLLPQYEDKRPAIELLKPALLCILKKWEALEEWGARCDDFEVNVYAANLDPDNNALIFEGTNLWHQDLEWSGSEYVTLRYLTSNTLPPRFIDTTRKKHYRKRKAFKRETEERDNLFSRNIEAYARQNGLFVMPKVAELVMFDGGTIHKAICAEEPVDRVLIDFNQRITLPKNFKERLAAGDIPKLG